MPTPTLTLRFIYYFKYRKSRWKQIRKQDTKGACTYTGPILKCFTTENVKLDLSLRKEKKKTVNNGKNKKKRLILIIATLKPFGFELGS